MEILNNFLLIRVATGLVGIFIPFLLVKQMSTPDFAMYSIVSASAALAVAMSSVGVDRACLKAFPSFSSNIIDRRLGKLVCGLAVTRFAALLVVVFLLLWFGVGLPDTRLAYTQDVSLVLTLVAATAVSTALNQFIAATVQGLLLHNAFARVLFSVTLLRAALFLFAPLVGTPLDFVVALIVVVVTELVAVLIQVAIVVVHASRRVTAPSMPAGGILTLGATIRHGLTNYTSYMAALPWSPAALILLVSNFSTVEDTASFAFFLNLADRARQFLPAQLLQSYVEPIWTRRFNACNRVQQMTRPAGLLIKANVLVVSFALFILASVGEELSRNFLRESYAADIHILILILVQVGFGSINSVLWVGLNVTGEIRMLTRQYIVISTCLAPIMFISAKYGRPELIIIVCMLPPILLLLTLRICRASFAMLRLPLLVMPQMMATGYLTGVAVDFVINQIISGSFLLKVGVVAFGTLAWCVIIFSLSAFSRSETLMLRKLS